MLLQRLVSVYRLVSAIREIVLEGRRTGHLSIEFLQLAFEAGEDERGPFEPVAVLLVSDLVGIHPDLGDSVQQKTGLLRQ